MMRRRPTACSPSSPHNSNGLLLSSNHGKQSTSKFGAKRSKQLLLWGATLFLALVILLIATWFLLTTPTPEWKPEWKRSELPLEQVQGPPEPTTTTTTTAATVQLEPIRFQADQHAVDSTEAMYVTLPPELTESVRQFVTESGLMESFRSLLYGPKKMKPGSSKVLKLHGNRRWAAIAPQWPSSDVHWVNAVDEENFEEAIAVLRRGNFDAVLAELGPTVGADGFMLAGMGFIIASQTAVGVLHKDLPKARGQMWDLLFPLVLPTTASAALLVGDSRPGKEDSRWASVPFAPDIGLLIGGDTWHGTDECDVHEAGEFRVAVSVYLADVNESNAERVAQEGTAAFPAYGQTEWVLAEKGRLWSRAGASIGRDVGRKPYEPQDVKGVDCAKVAARGLCDRDLDGARLKCLKTCAVYIDDERYFRDFFLRVS